MVHINRILHFHKDHVLLISPRCIWDLYMFYLFRFSMFLALFFRWQVILDCFYNVNGHFWRFNFVLWSVITAIFFFWLPRLYFAIIFHDCLFFWYQCLSMSQLWIMKIHSVHYFAMAIPAVKCNLYVWCFSYCYWDFSFGDFLFRIKNLFN